MYPAPKVRHYTSTLSDNTPVEVLQDFGDQVHFGVTFTIQNIDETANVFIGDADVDTDNWGMKLTPGAIASFEDMPKNAGIYAVSSVDGSSIAVLRVSK